MIMIATAPIIFSVERSHTAFQNGMSAAYSNADHSSDSSHEVSRQFTLQWKHTSSAPDVIKVGSIWLSLWYRNHFIALFSRSGRYTARNP